MTQICKFYMDNGCDNENCKFIHDPELCVVYWTKGKCLMQDCKYQHKYINQICKNFLKFNTCKLYTLFIIKASTGSVLLFIYYILVYRKYLIYLLLLLVLIFYQYLFEINSRSISLFIK